MTTHDVHTTPLRVLTAITSAQEPAIIELLSRQRTTIDIVRRCADMTEARGYAGAGIANAIIMSSDFPGFDRSAVDAFATHNVTLVVLNNPDDQYSTQRLAALGVRHTLTYKDISTRLIDTLTKAHTTPTTSEDLPIEWTSSRENHNLTLEPPTTNGRIIAVWGTHGAPGRSTLTTNLAYGLAHRNQLTKRRRKTNPTPETPTSAIIVDADTQSPSITQALGLLDESSGLAQACRAASQGLLNTRALTKYLAGITPQLGVLTGLPRASRWPELSAPNLQTVFTAARTAAHWTLVDCAPDIDEDDFAAFDPRAPRRNAATTTSLHHADLILVTGTGDPVGTTRMVRALETISTNPDLAHIPRIVVVNKVRSTTAGPSSPRGIRLALSRFTQELPPVLLSDAPALADKALMNGRVILEESPNSGLGKELVALIDLIVAGFGDQPQAPAPQAAEPVAASAV